jgi:hypothetical protein
LVIGKSVEVTGEGSDSDGLRVLAGCKVRGRRNGCRH